MQEAVIVDAVRTPMAKSKNGMFRNRRADDISGDLCDLYLGEILICQQKKLKMLSGVVYSRL